MINEIILNHKTVSNETGVELTFEKLKEMLADTEIKKISLFPDFTEKSFEKELTLYLSPINIMTTGRIKRDIFGKQYIDLKNQINGLAGSFAFSSIYEYRQIEEGQFNLKINFMGKKITIGHYFSNRNIILLNLPLNPSSFNFDLREYLIFLIECLLVSLYKIPLQNKDLTDFIEKYTLTTFFKSAKDIISNFYTDETSYEEILIDLSEKKIEVEQKLDLTQKSLVNLRSIIDQGVDKIYEDIKKIKELKFVTNVELTSEGVKVHFEPIYIDVDNKPLLMGNYIITISATSLKIYNKDFIEVNGASFHSPHIRGRSICFGKQQNYVESLRESMDFKKLIHFIYLFLKSYNPEDTYISMDYFIKERRKNESQNNQRSE